MSRSKLTVRAIATMMFLSIGFDILTAPQTPPCTARSQEGQRRRDTPTARLQAIERVARMLGLPGAGTATNCGISKYRAA